MPCPPPAAECSKAEPLTEAATSGEHTEELLTPVREAVQAVGMYRLLGIGLGKALGIGLDISFGVALAGWLAGWLAGRSQGA